MTDDSNRTTAPTGQARSGIWTPPAGARRIERLRAPRVIAGVCSGLGRSTGVDPVVFRVIVAVLSITGAGVLLYVGAWLALPAEGDEVSPAEALLGRGTSATAPATTVLLGLLGVLGLLWVAGAHGTGGILLAAAIVGLVLLLRRSGHTTAWPSPAQGRSAPGAIEPYALHGPYGASGTPATGRYTAPFQAQEPEPAYPAQQPEVPPSAQQPAPGPEVQPQPEAPLSAQPEPELAYPSRQPEPAFPSYGAWQPPPVATQPLPLTRTRQRPWLGVGTVVLALLGVAAMVGFDQLGWANFAPADLLALPLGILGLGLVLSTLFGRARALIGVGLLLTVAVVAIEAVGLSSFADLPHRVGDQTLRPASLAAVERTYRGGVGDTTLDLSRVHFTGTATAVSVDSGIGDVAVTVPADTDVTIDVRRGLGNLTLYGERVSARHVQRTDTSADGPGGGSLDMTISSGVGDVEVTRASS